MGSLPVLWALVARRRSLPDILCDMRRKHGPIFMLKLGPLRQVWVGSQEWLNKVYEAEGCAGRPASFKDPFGNFLFLVKDPKDAQPIREKQKAWLEENLDAGEVAKVAEAALEEHVWPELDAGSPKAFPDDAMRLAMYSALTKAILGASAELEEAELKRLMAATREYSEMRVKGKFGKSQDGSQLPPGAADIRAVVEAAMARAGRKDDIGLPLLVAASVGGAEIFPTLMHWILLYLAREGKQQEAAREAAKSGDSEALLKEMYRALRSTAYSVALGPPRKVLADSSVDGLEIPEGALLFALHPALVDRALEREPGPEEDFSQYAFGVGPRSCLGRPLAEAILPAVLGAILKRYEIAVPPEHKGEYKEALQGKMMGQLIRPSSSPRLAWLRP